MRLTVALFLITAVPAAASSLDAHEHGVTKLNLAVEDDGVEIELEAPGVDIVGFEHEPTTDAQKAAIDAAVASLGEAGRLFTFPSAAGCTVEEVEVEADQLEHSHGGEEHGEYHAHYHFECTDTSAITSVQTAFFEMFPNAEEIEMQAITASGQTAAELTASEPSASF